VIQRTCQNFVMPARPWVGSLSLRPAERRPAITGVRFVMGDDGVMPDREYPAWVARTGPVPKHPKPVAGPIVAREPSRCGTCRREITPGDVITKGNEKLGWRHEACTAKELR
jgi:hypothetical protein